MITVNGNTYKITEIKYNELMLVKVNGGETQIMKIYAPSDQEVNMEYAYQYLTDLLSE